MPIQSHPLAIMIMSHRAQALFLRGCSCVLMLGAGLLLQGEGNLRQGTFQLSLGQGVQAQEPGNSAISPQKLEQFANAIFRIETTRASVFSSIKTQLQEYNVQSMPEITCNNPRSLDDISNDVPRTVRNAIRQQVVDFCNGSMAIVQNNGLSSTEFNNLTKLMNNQPEVRAQIEKILRRLATTGN